MRYETWVRIFKPLKNHLTAGTAIDGCVFLPGGEDLRFVRSEPQKNVWTFIISDEGRTPAWLICDGFHVVNAMGYLVTRMPREDTKFYEIHY